MELRFFRLSTNNGQEFIIESQYDVIVNVEDVDRRFIPILQKGNKEAKPLHLRVDQIFSIQEVNSGIIGSQTRLWKYI